MVHVQDDDKVDEGTRISLRWTCGPIPPVGRLDVSEHHKPKNPLDDLQKRYRPLRAVGPRIDASYEISIVQGRSKGLDSQAYR